MTCDISPAAAAVERRDVELVARADAAVVVWDDRDPTVRRIVVLIEGKGMPVHVLGAPAQTPKGRWVRDEAQEPKRRGTPPD